MVQDLAKQLITEAKSGQVQDIYLIPKKDDYEVYYRSGSQRRLVGRYDSQLMASLISHFKFVSGMNVGEKRRTQLGSCDYDCGDQLVSMRLSSVGDYRGQESLVLRLLFDGRQELHYWADSFERLKPNIQARGLYVFAGPVGSGKTTLMHQLVLGKYADQQIISIEDPVEIKEERFLQLQLNGSIGLTYDSLIKLSLRHRPDILIIGEIRDSETARAVVRASLTGAVVFSTVHAKSIPGVYARLLELGVSPDELRHCLAGICYQRLIGRGALIDVATEDFINHQPDWWNQQIDDLVDQGHLTDQEGELEKIIPQGAGQVGAAAG